MRFPIVILLFALFQSGIHENDENKLLSVINDLSVVARLINGISVQSEFMRSSQNLNAVVGELLGIGDSIPELLKVKVKDLMNDVDGVMGDVKNISSFNNDSKAISQVVKLMKSVNLEEVRNAEKIDFQGLRTNWTEAMKTDFYPLENWSFLEGIATLNRLLNTSLPDNEPQQQALLRELQSFADKVGTIGSTFDKVQKLSEDSLLWSILGKKSSFEMLLPIAKVAQGYTDNFISVAKLRQEIASFGYTVPRMERVLKRRRSFDNWEIVVSSTDKITDKSYRWNNLISDLELLFEDLNGTSLQEILREDLTMLITALHPLQKFQENLKPLEVIWSRLRQNQNIGEVVGSIVMILKNGEVVKADELIRNSVNASECVKAMGNIPRTLTPRNFHEFYNNLDNFDAQLNSLKTAAHDFITSPIAPKLDKFKPGLFTISQYSVGNAQRQEELDKVLLYQDIRNISKVITKFAEAVKSIDFGVIRKVKGLWNDGFEVQTSLVKTGLVDAIECLNGEKFDFTGAEAFYEVKTGVEALKHESDALEMMKVFGEAIDSLISADKKLKGLVRRRRRRSPKLLNLENSGKLAQDIGNGVQVLKEMSEVFENQREVLKVAKSADSVDTVIQKIPEMAGKWTVGNKKALEKLVDEVNKLNRNVGKDRSLESLWKPFGAAQSVNGAPIESRILRHSVYAVLEKSSDENVKNAAVDFRSFPDVQLDFTGQKRIYLQQASGILAPITAFFKDFFTIHTSTPETIDLTEYIPTISGICGSLLCIALLVGGVYGFMKYRSWKQWNLEERHLIYIAFRRPGQAETLVEAMGSYAHRLSHGLIIEGRWINQYGRIDDEYKTAMNIAVEHTDEVIFQFFLENGGDPWMETSGRENCKDILMRIWEKDNIRGDPNEKKLASKKKILELLNDFPNQPKRYQEIPQLLPSYIFSIFLLPDQFPKFRSDFAEHVCAPGEFNVYSTTHAVVPVDWRGIAHFEKDKFSFYFKAVFSPAILVSPKWIELVMKDQEKNFAKDYENRVTKIELKGKVYKNLDQLKRFARGRHMPVGAGLCLFLLSNDEELIGVMENLGFKVILYFCLEDMEDAHSYHRTYTKNFVVSDYTLSHDEEFKKRRCVSYDEHTVMSLEEFAVHLLEMEITGKDGEVVGGADG